MAVRWNVTSPYSGAGRAATPRPSAPLSSAPAWSLIEADRVGGTCITVGCIPTKAWVQTAHALKEANGHFAQLGVKVASAELDFAQAQANKQGIVDGLVNGITGVVKANEIAIVSGRGVVHRRRTRSPSRAARTSRFQSAVVATGSQSLRPPVDGIDGPRCVDSTGLLEIEEVPKRLAILGGGVIGVEFASIFSHFGTEVTIVEMLDHLIPMEDEDASKELERAFKKRKIATHLGARATADRGFRRGGHAALRGQGRRARRASRPTSCWSRPAAARGCATSASRPPASSTTRAAASSPTGTCARTSSHIYAVGDVAGVYQLAHTAFREGEVAAENALGHDGEMDYSAVPRCVYTDPEVAAVGLTEAQAREAHGDDVVIGKFPFAASGRAQMYGERTGLCEDDPRDALRRAARPRHRRASRRPSSSTRASIGITAEATIETIADSIAAHPTLAEAVKEAALVALGRPIHLPPPRPRAKAAAR